MVKTKTKSKVKNPIDSRPPIKKKNIAALATGKNIFDWKNHTKKNSNKEALGTNLIKNHTTGDKTTRIIKSLINQKWPATGCPPMPTIAAKQFITPDSGTGL